MPALGGQDAHRCSSRAQGAEEAQLFPAQIPSPPALSPLGRGRETGPVSGCPPNSHEIVMDGVTRQIRVGFHFHFFEHTSAVSADRLDAE